MTSGTSRPAPRRTPRRAEPAPAPLPAHAALLPSFLRAFGRLGQLARLAVLAALALPCAGLAAPAAAGWSLDTLMQALARQPAGHARFTETKTIALLDQPLVSQGELVHAPPDRLEKHTRQPQAESMRVAGDTLTLARDGQTHVLHLPEQPQAQAIVDAVRGTLTGNQALLARHYAMRLRGTAARWQLVLTPRGAAMRQWVRQIEVSGAQGRIQQIETVQTDGDRSLLVITPCPGNGPCGSAP